MQTIATIHVENGAGGELIANQEKQRFGNLGRTADAADRHVAPHLLKELCFFVGCHPVVHGRINQSGRKNIHPRESQFLGQRKCHGLNGAVDGGHAGSVGDRRSTRAARYEGDGARFLELRKSRLDTEKEAVEFLIKRDPQGVKLEFAKRSQAA